MLTRSVQSALVVTPTGVQGPPQARHPWLAASLALLTALSAATYWSAVRVASADSAGGPPSTDGRVGLVTSFGQRPSHNGRYTAEVVSTSPVAVGVAQSWTVHLSRRTRRLSLASVEASVWMPETSESSPVRPSIRYVGGGNYRVENVLFTRPGWWNVALVIDGSSGTDSVAFNLIIPPPGRAAAPTSDAVSLPKARRSVPSARPHAG